MTEVVNAGMISPDLIYSRWSGDSTEEKLAYTKMMSTNFKLLSHHATTQEGMLQDDDSTAKRSLFTSAI